MITEEMKQEAQAEFASLLTDMKMSDGKLSYSKSFKCENSEAVVWLTPEAYRKILISKRCSTFARA